MANGLTRVVVREQNPQVRATNFEELCYGYNKEEAMEEAARCLNCKKPKCVEGCPVSINIPAFIAEVKEGNFEEAFKIISQSSALPAVCGRVCPQESQCEGKCVRGIKGDPVAIVNWSVSLLTRQERTVSNRKLRLRRMVRKLQLSVLVLPD